ncbi:putative MFS transporter [Westerdykella ornata]|uniref:Putative MFS transporter n=1 Tax=Westerdykella ornata TaxID=318751 RepID=A0A6A6JA50_WESOR|nr:putative MFS transporter [Westerdykella ornata]KAF2272506.1 putative MFS transporter [Westerdykella ornata]
MIEKASSIAPPSIQDAEKSSSKSSKGSPDHEKPPSGLPNGFETTTPRAQEGPEPPPNGGYGWIVTFCVALINAHTWGINSSYGVFLAYYLSNSLYPSATPLKFAIIGGISISTAMFISPLATLSTRYFGTHKTLIFGIVFEAGGLIGASFASTIWQLALSQGLAFGVGMGFLFVASVGIPPQWFTTRRSLSNGIAASGSGFGGLLYSLATGAMLRSPSIGLKWCFRILGLLALVVNTICTLLIRDRNKIIGRRHKAFDLKLFRRPEYPLLNGYGSFSMLGYIALVFSLADYAKRIGLSASQASVVTSVLNLGQGLGRPPTGYFSDGVGRINMAALTTFFCAVMAFAVWVPAKSYGVLIFYALVGGTVTGTFWATIGPVAVEVVGLQDLPSALNLEWLVIVLPCTFSEPISLELVKFTGGYLSSQLFIGFSYAAAALCVVFLRGWKIGEVEYVGNGGDAGVEDVGLESMEDRARAAGRLTIWKHFWRWRKV